VIKMMVLAAVAIVWIETTLVYMIWSVVLEFARCNRLNKVDEILK
jgi:hypothetical protein